MYIIFYVFVVYNIYMNWCIICIYYYLDLKIMGKCSFDVLYVFKRMNKLVVCREMLIYIEILYI